MTDNYTETLDFLSSYRSMICLLRDNNIDYKSFVDEYKNLDYEAFETVKSPIEKIMMCLLWIIEAEEDLYFESGEKIENFTPDFLCKSIGLIIECDGDSFHNNEKIIHKDKRRDRFFSSKGITTVRYTGKEILYKPFYVLNDIKKIIRGLR